LQGWCQDDGAAMIFIDVTIPGLTMTQSKYEKWWDRFRGSMRDDERELYFNSNNYEAYGSHSAPFMAASDVYTTAFYECGIHEFIPEEGDQNPPVFAFNFD
jgi:hypothetical protein